MCIGIYDRAYSPSIIDTRIFGAYGPIMFALWVWVGFEASWRGGPLIENCNSSFMFGRTHGIMFGRTLFEYCVRKDTLNYVRKDTLNYVWKDTLNYVRKDTFQNVINKTF